ncbi:CHC2 zinc finger domain-containing protein [Mucilaginibacter sp. McL0603]|uniref:CHC2 zinc finger domain-containing protein n=1 Tax=Mucilaginibacter sp. McL0603 TaxID=3415670 RepID=UPI003CEB0239
MPDEKDMSQEQNIQTIQSKANLVKIVSAYLPLTKSRLAMKGNCPFHPDSAHSFMVSPAKNIFKCFGCGKEGGPVEFIMAIQNKKFDEAAEIAAMTIEL